MDDQQQFCLRWNDFQTNMVASFKHLRDEKSFTDVTIACDGQSCKAHKMILSACSPYFKSLLEENPATRKTAASLDEYLVVLSLVGDAFIIYV